MHPLWDGSANSMDLVPVVLIAFRMYPLWDGSDRSREVGQRLNEFQMHPLWDGSLDHYCGAFSPEACSRCTRCGIEEPSRRAGSGRSRRFQTYPLWDGSTVAHVRFSTDTPSSRCTRCGIEATPWRLSRLGAATFQMHPLWDGSYDGGVVGPLATGVPDVPVVGLKRRVNREARQGRGFQMYPLWDGSLAPYRDHAERDWLQMHPLWDGSDLALMRHYHINERSRCTRCGIEAVRRPNRVWKLHWFEMHPLWDGSAANRMPAMCEDTVPDVPVVGLKQGDHRGRPDERRGFQMHPLWNGSTRPVTESQGEPVFQMHPLWDGSLHTSAFTDEKREFRMHPLWDGNSMDSGTDRTEIVTFQMHPLWGGIETAVKPSSLSVSQMHLFDIVFESRTRDCSLGGLRSLRRSKFRGGLSYPRSVRPQIHHLLRLVGFLRLDATIPSGITSMARKITHRSQISVNPPGVRGGLRVDGNTKWEPASKSSYTPDLGMVPDAPAVGLKRSDSTARLQPPRVPDAPAVGLKLRREAATPRLTVEFQMHSLWDGSNLALELAKENEGSRCTRCGIEASSRAGSRCGSQRFQMHPLWDGSWETEQDLTDAEQFQMHPLWDGSPVLPLTWRPASEFQMHPLWD